LVFEFVFFMMVSASHILSLASLEPLNGPPLGYDALANSLDFGLMARKIIAVFPVSFTEK